MGLELRHYAVIAGGKMSKIWAYTKGEASRFVENVIEIRASHALLEELGGAGSIKSYFADTDIMKKLLEKRIDTLIENLTTQNNGGENESTATDEKSEEIKGILLSAKKSVHNVEDGSDFNAENIDQAKNLIGDALKKYRERITDSVPTTLVNDTVLNDSKNGIFKGLNRLRKWQLNVFEEEYVAEIYTTVYHDYIYAKTVKELCKKILSKVKEMGKTVTLNPDEYGEGKSFAHEAMENAVKAAFNEDEVVRINIGFCDNDFELDSETASNGEGD